MKRFTIGLFTVTLALVSIAFTAFTPTPENIGVDVPDELVITDQWVALASQSGIDISYKFADCHLAKFNWEQRWVLLKVENTSGATKSIDWDAQMWFDGVCKTCNDPNGEYHRTLIVDGGQTLEAECDLNVDGRMFFFIKFNDKPNVEELTRFELANFVVSD
jgi:hypothetical protein